MRVAGRTTYRRVSADKEDARGTPARPTDEATVVAAFGNTARAPRPRHLIYSRTTPMRSALVVLTLAVLAALLAAPAQAATRTYTLRSGPVHMGGFNVKFPKRPVKAPNVNGYVVGMTVDLVDKRGRAITIRDVMLHHVVFHRRAAGAPSAGRARAAYSEPIYGTGEEKQDLRFPRGYGYRIRRGDRWRVTAMLMSHSIRPKNAYIRYRVKVVTGKRLTAVRAVLAARQRVRQAGELPGARRRPAGLDEPRSFDVAGADRRPHRRGRRPPPRQREEHVALAAALREPAPARHRAPLRHARTTSTTAPARSCTSRGRSTPATSCRARASRSGKGERIRITGTYEGSRPHPRVMSIMHVYIAPARDVPKRCKPLPADRKELEKPGPVRTEPPQVVVPLNGVRPNGRTFIVKTPADGARRLKQRATVSLRAGALHAGAHLGAGRREGHLALRRRDPAQRPARQRPAADRHADAQRRRDQVVVLPQARPLRAVLLPAPDDDARGGRRATTALNRRTRGPRRTAGPSGSG